MFFNKANLSRFVFGFGIIIAVITAFVFIIWKNCAIVQKHSTISQKRYEESNDATHSDRNQLLTGHIPSEQEKRASKIRNLEKAQSRFSKKMGALELTLNKLEEDLNSIAERDFSGNTDQDRDLRAPEMEKEEIIAQINDRLDLLQETLQSEPVDEEWSESVMKVLYESFQENTYRDFQIASVDCRSTLCRLDLTFDPDLSKDSFLEFPEIIPWSGRRFLHVNDTSGEAVLYVAREGYSLPRQVE